MSDTAEAPAKKGGKKSPLVMIIAAVVAAAVAGGGVFWYLRGGTPVEAAEGEAGHKKDHVKASERGIVPFEPFVVNLADANASRFLRVTVQIVVRDAEEAEHLHKTPVLMMQARSAVLELLTMQTSDRLVTPEGKTELKKAIAERISEAIEEVKVLDVLFSDFVVQL